MFNLFSKLNESGIGTSDIVCVEGVTMSVKRVRWGYEIQVIENTGKYFYFYEGFKAVLSEGFVEGFCRDEYSFRNLQRYYLGYNPDLSIRELELFNLLLEGVYHSD